MIRASSARALTTPAEYDLIQKATPKYIGKLSQRELKSGVDRARKLRDKYRKLGERQRRAVRGKSERAGKKISRAASAASSNENTLKKHELFDEAMERYQARLDHLRGSDAEVVTPATRPKRKKAKKTSKRAGKTQTKTKPKTKAERAEVVEVMDIVMVPAPRPKPGTRAAKKTGSVRSLLAGTGGIPIGALWSPDDTSPGAVAARNVSLRARTKKAPSNRRNILSNTVRIKGHSSSATRRRQAKRDATQRTGRPSA